MSKTTDTVGPATGGATSTRALPTARTRTDLPTRERKPTYVALAVALIVGLGAAGGYSYSKAGHKTPVVVVINDIPAGHVISRSDLSTVSVAGDVTAIAAVNIDSVVGQTAAVELLPNTLLQRSAVTRAAPLNPSNGQVGVEVKGSQLPAAGVAPGDTVQVIVLPSSAGSTTAGPTIVPDLATVVEARQDPADAGGTLVTLSVPKRDAPAIAAASSAGLIALVRVAK